MEKLMRFDGPIAPCTCTKQPRHLFRLGPQTHAVDCPPCGVRTGFYPTAQQAVEDWERLMQGNHHEK